MLGLPLHWLSDCHHASNHLCEHHSVVSESSADAEVVGDPSVEEHLHSNHHSHAGDHPTAQHSRECSHGHVAKSPVGSVDSRVDAATSSEHDCPLESIVCTGADEDHCSVCEMIWSLAHSGGWTDCPVAMTVSVNRSSVLMPNVVESSHLRFGYSSRAPPAIAS
jgi:hypothetical protein